MKSYAEENNSLIAHTNNNNKEQKLPQNTNDLIMNDKTNDYNNINNNKNNDEINNLNDNNNNKNDFPFFPNLGSNNFDRGNPNSNLGINDFLSNLGNAIARQQMSNLNDLNNMINKITVCSQQNISEMKNLKIQ